MCEAMGYFCKKTNYQKWLLVFFVCLFGTIVGVASSYSLMAFTLKEVFLLVIGVIAVFLTLVKPYLGPLFVLFLSNIFSESTGVSLSEIALYVFLFATLAGIIIRVRRQPSFFLPEEPLSKPLSVFLLFCFGGMLIGLFYSNSLYDLLSETGRMAFYSLYFFFIFFFTLKEMQLVLLGLGGVATFISAKAYYLFFLGVEQKYLEIGSTQVDRIITNLPILLVPISFALLLYSKTWKIRLPLMLLTIFWMGAGFLSFTRTLWVGFFASIGLLIYFIFTERVEIKRILGIRLFIAIAAAILMLLVMIIFSPTVRFVAEYFWTRVFLSSSSVGAERGIQARLIENEIVLDLIKKRPLWGYGWGSKYRSYMFYMVMDPARVSTTALVHNGFLYMAYKLGLFGMAVFLWMLVRAIRFGIMIFGSAEDRYYRSLAVGITASLFSFIIGGFFSSPFHYYSSISFFTFLMGFLVLLNDAIRRNRSTNNISAAQMTFYRLSKSQQRKEDFSDIL